MNNNSSGDLSKILGSAITSVSGVIGDVKNQIKREEFDLLKSMLAEIRIEQEIIKKKLQDLETK